MSNAERPDETRRLVSLARSCQDRPMQGRRQDNKDSLVVAKARVIRYPGVLGEANGLSIAQTEDFTR